MNFKLKPKRIIKFDNSITLLLSEHYFYNYGKFNDENYIMLLKTFVLNENIKNGDIVEVDKKDEFPYFDWNNNLPRHGKFIIRNHGNYYILLPANQTISNVE